MSITYHPDLHAEAAATGLNWVECTRHQGSGPLRDECPICRIPLEPNDSSITHSRNASQGCNNTFHEDCLTSWAQTMLSDNRRATCPFCFRPIVAQSSRHRRGPLPPFRPRLQPWSTDEVIEHMPLDEIESYKAYFHPMTLIDQPDPGVRMWLPGGMARTHEQADRHREYHDTFANKVIFLPETRRDPRLDGYFIPDLPPRRLNETVWLRIDLLQDDVRYLFVFMTRLEASYWLDTRDATDGFDNEDYVISPVQDWHNWHGLTLTSMMQHAAYRNVQYVATDSMGMLFPTILGSRDTFGISIFYHYSATGRRTARVDLTDHRDGRPLSETEALVTRMGAPPNINSRVVNLREEADTWGDSYINRVSWQIDNADQPPPVEWLNANQAPP